MNNTRQAPSQTPKSDWDEAFDEALAAELRRRATRHRVTILLPRWLARSSSLTVRAGRPG